MFFHISEVGMLAHDVLLDNSFYFSFYSFVESNIKKRINQTTSKWFFSFAECAKITLVKWSDAVSYTAASTSNTDGSVSSASAMWKISWNMESTRPKWEPSQNTLPHLVQT